MDGKKVAITLEQAESTNAQLELRDEDIDTFDALDGDPLEDLGIDFLLEEVENKIAPLALA